MTTVLFDGLLNVHYGYLNLRPEDEAPSDLALSFRTQTNGLLGAGEPEQLFLRVGLHTGAVPVRVVLADAAPPLGDWEEMVEAPYRLTMSGLWLTAFDDAVEIELEPGQYRARWSGSGMDEGHAQDTVLADETAPDRYELVLWPDTEGRPDEILRTTSEQATYWHTVAQRDD
jgi:hypothetical protein